MLVINSLMLVINSRINIVYCDLIRNKHLSCLRTTADIYSEVRALYGTKLLPVTHVLVDTWMLTIKQVSKL